MYVCMLYTSIDCATRVEKRRREKETLSFEPSREKELLTFFRCLFTHLVNVFFCIASRSSEITNRRNNWLENLIVAPILHVSGRHSNRDVGYRHFLHPPSLPFPPRRPVIAAVFTDYPSISALRR